MKPKFKQGDIIVQNVALCTETFAVYGGATYKSNPSQNKSSTKCNFDYSLALYFLEGECFEVDIDNGVDCGYVIGENQLTKWRKPTDGEMRQILKILEKNSLAYDFDNHAIRKLKVGEKLYFKDEEKEIEDTSSLKIPSSERQVSDIKIGNNCVKNMCKAINKAEEEKAKKAALKFMKKSKKGKGNAYNFILNSNKIFHNIFGMGKENLLNFDSESLEGRWEE